MTPQQFVNGLRSSIIEENLSIYRDLFSNTSICHAGDLYWRRALTLFSSLDEAQRETFFEVIRQVAVDTTSNVLGVIDGVSQIDNTDGELELRCDVTQRLSGDLQSMFLAEEERAARQRAGP